MVYIPAANEDEDMTEYSFQDFQKLVDEDKIRGDGYHEKQGKKYRKKASVCFFHWASSLYLRNRYDDRTDVGKDRYVTCKCPAES